MKRFDALRTDRLLLRRWRDGDREPFASMNADPRVRRYFPTVEDRATSDASIDLFESRLRTHGVGLWALEVVASGQFIGYTGLNPMPDGLLSQQCAGGWEIGWRLAASAWHQGYAAEAAAAVLGLALGELGLDVVWSLTAVANQPSIAVMRRIGMREFARTDHPRVAPEHPLRPHVVYRLTAAEHLGRA